MIVEGTREGLASARARGRAGGRPPALSQVRLDQAQRMYNEDSLTVEEIAKAFRVGRSTLYENLAAYKDGRDCVLVVYRNTRPGKVDDSNRRYGETGQSERVQLEADRKWWPVAPARQPRLEGIVYVVNGIVARIRAVDPEGAWQRDDRGYADIPLTPPLTDLQVAKQFPTLGIRLGGHRPHVRGKIREYLPLLPSGAGRRSGVPEAAQGSRRSRHHELSVGRLRIFLTRLSYTGSHDRHGPRLTILTPAGPSSWPILTGAPLYSRR